MIRRNSAIFLFAAGAATAQDKITYQDHVRPILENRCLNCHNAEKKRGGLDLSTFGSAMAGGSGGVNLEPGDPSASQFFKVITHQAEPFMPPKSDKIPQSEIDVISKWIAGGLLDTASSTAKVKKKSGFAMAAGGSAGKPEGPPAMPEHLLLEPVVVPPRPAAATAMAHSPWAPLLAVGSAKQVLLYHSETRDLLGVLPFPEGGFPESVGFSRNGALVLASGGTGGKKGIVAVWDVKTGNRVITVGEEFESIPAADITPDYRKIAFGTRERKVKIYDTASGQKLVEIKKHTDWVTTVAFSPDGVLLATGDRNGGLYVWETATGGEFYNLKGHEKMIAALAWRGDSNLVASGSEDGTWIWWEMMNGSQVKKQGSHGGVLALNFAPDGRMASGGRDGHARIWDANGNQKRDWVPSGGRMVLRTVFTPEGKELVTGAESGDIKIWDAGKDGGPAGEFAYNPPSIGAMIDLASQEAGARQAEADKAKAAAADMEKQMAAAKAEVESTRQAIAGAAAAADTAAKEADSIRQEAAKLETTRKTFAAGMEETKKQLAAAGAVTAPAPPAEDVPGPVQQVLKSAGEAELTLNTLSRAVLESKLKIQQEGLTRCETGVTARQKTVEERDQQAAAHRARKEAMEKSMPEKEQRVQETGKALAAMQPALEAALAALAGPHRRLQYWRAAQENKGALALRTEAAALKEKVEDLKAEIPELEKEVQVLTEQKSSIPPPKPEDAAKADKKLALAARRLAEAKAALAKAEPELPEKERAAEESWQKYLSMLPK